MSAARQLELVAGILRPKPAPLRRGARSFLLEIEPEDLDRNLVAAGLSPDAFWSSIGGRRRLGIVQAGSFVRSFRRGQR